MTDEKQVFNILVPEEYTTSNGEVKTFFHRVGTGWKNKKGGINCRVPPGIALSGDFTILPRTSKAEDDGPDHAPEDDEIPY